MPTQVHTLVEKGQRRPGTGLVGLLCQGSGEEAHACLECWGGYGYDFNFPW